MADLRPSSPLISLCLFEMFALCRVSYVELKNVEKVLDDRDDGAALYAEHMEGPISKLATTLDASTARVGDGDWYTRLRLCIDGSDEAVVNNKKPEQGRGEAKNYSLFFRGSSQSPEEIANVIRLSFESGEACVVVERSDSRERLENLRPCDVWQHAKRFGVEEMLHSFMADAVQEVIRGSKE